MANNDYLSYISHYGIPGQKWGIRRYQYQDGSLTPEGKSRYGHTLNYKIPQYKSYAAFVAKQVGINVAFSELASKVPGVAEVALINDIYKNGGIVRGRTEKYVKKDGEFEKIKELKRKKSKDLPEDYVKSINPRANKKGGINNCVLCSIAMVMNDKGFDVRARQTDKGYNLNDGFEQFGFKNAKTYRYTPLKRYKEEMSRKERSNAVYNDVCTKIASYGKGACGVIGNRWNLSLSGHAIFWKVNNEGIPKFYDGQTGKEDTGEFFSLSNLKEYGITRLDNCKINDDIGKYVVSNKEDLKHD